MWMFWAAAEAASLAEGLAALERGDLVMAEQQLEQLPPEAQSKATDAWWQLGQAYYERKQWMDASEAWARLQRLEPDRAEIDFWLRAAKERDRLSKVAIPTGPVDEVPREGAIRIAAVGDTMMGSDLKKGAAGLAPGQGEGLFAEVKPIVSAADIAFLNLEGPLADGLPSTKCRPDSTACYAFRTPTRYASALKDAGFDVASLANNHAWDLGVAGQESTMKALDGQGISHAGRFGDVAYLEYEGTKVAVVAAHFGSCCLNVNEIAEIQRAVADADVLADIVVLSYHSGAEGAKAQHVTGEDEVAWGEKRGNTKKLARAAVDAGADLVVAHGPHVLRAMEVYKGRLIAHSLGNFMGFRQFGTGGGPTGTSLVLDVELASNGVLKSAKIHPVALDKESIPGLDPTGAAYRYIRELSAKDFPETGVRVDEQGNLSWGKPK